ncbi:TrbI/VirB10 family protein [Xanthomonas euvesicatoria]
MSTKAQNIKATMKNPRTRLVYVGGLILTLVIALIAVAVLMRGGKEIDTSKVADVPTVTTSYKNAEKATPQYDALLKQNNADNAKSALANGESSIPTPRMSADAPKSELVGVDTPKPVVESAGSVAPTAPAQPAYSPEELQRHESEVVAREQAMKQQLAKIVTYWDVAPHQSFQIAKDQQAPAAAPSTTAALVAANGSANLGATAASLKVGDMLYATLDTAINTDQPGPVLATVRQPGPFKGAKLLGSMQQSGQGKAVGIQFTAMSVPGEASSRSISAWAVDPNKDYRTALASDVNNHYVIRGLSTFVGAFVSGYADGLIQGGQNQQVVQSDGYAVVQQDAYTTKQLNQIGLGNVGRKWAQEMDKSSDRKPTITVDAGIDVGILFTQDMTDAKS